MQKIYPIKLSANVCRGMEKADVPTNCQSKQRLSKPRPSLLLAPPKIFVKSRLFLLVRQKTLTPVRMGIIHWGNHCHTKTTANMTPVARVRNQTGLTVLLGCHTYRKAESSPSSPLSVDVKCQPGRLLVDLWDEPFW